MTGWINALTQVLKDHLEDNTKRLFHHSKRQHYQTDDQITNAISIKLDALSKLLGLNPFQNGKLQQNLKPIDDFVIQPIYVICLEALECKTEFCSGHYLNQNTWNQNILHVTLIKGAKIFMCLVANAITVPQYTMLIMKVHVNLRPTETGINII